MIGRMVRAGGSPPMKVMDIRNGVARCILVDSDGRIRGRFHDIDQLTPIWLSFQPKSSWPEATGFDLIEIEKEEARAEEIRRQQRRAARRSKRSHKIKRRALVPA